MTERIRRDVCFSIEVGGSPLSFEDLARIDNIGIVDHIKGMDKAYFAVADYDYKYQDRFREGLSVKVRIGYLEGDQYTFLGEIVAIQYTYGEDGLPLIKVDCRNRAKEMTESQSHKTWEGKTSSEIVEEIASGYGLRTFVQHTEVTSFLGQAGITDAAMISMLAAQENFIFKVRGNSLYFGPSGANRTAKRLFEYRTGEKTIKFAEMRINIDEGARNVVASQVSEREAISITATGLGAESQGQESSVDSAAEGSGAIGDDDGVNFGEFEDRVTD